MTLPEDNPPAPMIEALTPGVPLQPDAPVASAPPSAPAPRGSNSLVKLYRQRVPNDRRSDAQLTQMFGQQNDQDGRYNDFKDFVSEYAATKPPPSPSMEFPVGVGEEFGRGVSSGTEGLKSSALGLGALAAGAVGADSLKQSLATRFQQSEEAAAANGPTISRVEDIKSPTDALRYVLGKAGELLPNVAEATLFGAAGAAAGTAVEPVGGTAAGGAGGLIEGFVARKAARSALKAVVDGLVEVADKKAVTAELEGIVKSGVSQTLTSQTRGLLETEAKSMAQRYGANAANVLNFYGQGAGAEYGKLLNNPQISDDDARTAAAIAGLGSSGSVLLPAAITQKLFPGVAHEVANTYVRRLAIDAVKEIPMAASGMGLMEVANIAADRYADPEKRDQPLTSDELSRILNASVVGGMAGAVSSLATAIPGPRKAQHFDSTLENHLENLPDDRRIQLQELKGRIETPDAKPSQEDLNARRTMTPAEQKFYALADPLAPVKEDPTESKSPQTTAPLETPAGTGSANPPAAPEPAPKELTRERVLKAGNEEFFDLGQRIQQEATAGNGDGLQTMAEDAARKDPDLDAWKKAHADAEADGERIKSEILAVKGTDQDKVDAALARQKELMGMAQRAQFFGEGIKVLQAKIDTENAAKRAASNVSLAPKNDALAAAAKSAVKAASDQTDKNPSTKQKLAGNYPMGKISPEGMEAMGLKGLVISIETPKDSDRTAVDGSWKVKMPGDYGRFLGTVGKDKDHVDVTIGPNPTAPEVYVVDQVKADGTFDEHKALIGYDSRAAAEAAYDASFSDGKGPQRRAAVTTMSKEQLKEFLRDKSATQKPLSKEVFHASSKPSAKPSDAGGVKPEVTTQLAGKETTTAEGGKGLRERDQEGKQPSAAGGESKPAKENAPSERLLGKVKPKKEPVKTAEDLKIEQARDEMADLLKELEEVSVHGMPGETKLTLNPKDYLGLDPKMVTILGKVALKAIEIGGYKFEKFAKAFTKIVGEKFSHLVASIYEAFREQYPDKAKEMTPVGDMADKIDAFAEHLKAGEKEELIPNDRRVTVSDIDFAGKGVRDVSARGVDSPEVAKLWENDRERILTAYNSRNARARAQLEARRKGINVPSKLTKDAYRTALQTPKWEDLVPETKEVFVEALNHTLTDQQKIDVFGHEAAVKEPAYFVPKQGVPFETLARQLTSDSAPEGNRANTVTHRLVDIRDNDTGEIHRVSVWENNRSADSKPEDYVYVTKAFDGAKGMGRDSVKLSSVLAVRGEDGSNRYRLVGSLLTKTPTEGYHSVFKDRAAYNESFAKEAGEAAKATASGARAEELKMEAHGKELGRGESTAPVPGELAEHETEERPQGGAVEAHTPEPQREPKELNLEPNDMKVLREMPPFENLDELVNLLKTPAITPEMEEVIHKITQADRYFWTRVEETNLGEALKEYGYDIDARESGRVEPAAVGTAQAGVRPAGVGERVRVSEPQTPMAGRENSPGQPRQAGVGGDKVVNHSRQTQVALQRAKERGAVEQAVRRSKGTQEQPTMFRRPDGNPPTEEDRQTMDRLRGIHEAAQSAGIDVQAIKGDKAMGAYDPANRTLYHVMGDVVGSGDVVTALHEVGHDVFAHETPEVQERLTKGIHSLSDEALGIDVSADSRIRSSDPSGLGYSAVNQERLAEAVATRLEQQKFDPAEAKGFAKRFVRSLKDHYYRAAMDVQRWLGWEPSGDLALRYFENRVKRFLAGDTSRASFIDWLGVRRPSVGQRREYSYPSSRSTAERFSPDGHLAYEPVPELSVDATRFNLDSGLKFRDPTVGTDSPYSRTVDIERIAAVLNFKKEVLAKAGAALTSVPELAERMKGLKPDEYLRKLLNISDPEKSMKLLSKERETDGSAVAFDPKKTINDFQGKESTYQTALQAYITHEKIIDKVGWARNRATDRIQEAEYQIQKRSDAKTKAEKKVAELEAIKADKTKEVPGIDKQIAKAKRQAQGAQREVNSATNEAKKQKATISALDAIMPVLTSEHAKLTEKLKARPNFVFRNDAPYNVPDHPGATTEESLKLNKAGEIASVKKLQLDSSGKMMHPEELQADLRKMKAFLDKRDEMSRAGDQDAKDVLYQTVEQQYHEMMVHKNFSVDVAPYNKWSFFFNLLPEGRKMAEAFGTRASRSIMSRLNHFTSIVEAMHSSNERDGRRTGQLEDKLLELTPGLDRDHMRSLILTPARDKLSHQHDLDERYAGEPAALKRAQYGRVRDMLLSNKATRDHVGPVIDKFMPRLVDLIDHQTGMANGWVSALERSHLGVSDPRMKVVNPATGQSETALRRHIAIGYSSLPRKLNSNFGTMVKALRGSGWAQLKDYFRGADEEPSTFEKLYNEDPEKARADFQKYMEHDQHGDQVQREFFRALAEQDTQSNFDAPAKEEGMMPVDPYLAKKALEASGDADPIGFAEHLYDSYGPSEEEKGAYVARTMQKLVDLFSEADGMYRRFEPTDTPEGQWAIRGMSPDALIDARRVEHLPSTWFDYHSYDRRESFAMSQRIASEIAFGRGQEGLGADFDTLNKEVGAAKTRIGELTREFTSNNPTATAKQIDQHLREKLGTDYETLTRQATRSRMIDKSVRGLSDYFRKENAPDATLNWATRSAHALGQLLVNQPASAINMLEQLFGLHLRYGASGSVIRATAQTLKRFGSDAIGSLTDAIGIQMMNGGEFHRLYVDLRLTDSDVVKRFRDALDRQMGETPGRQVLRAGIEDVLGMGINRVGDKAEHPLFRPFQPFTWVAMLSDKALTEGIWRLAATHVGKAMEFYKANGDKLSDPNYKVSAADLGLKGLGKESFERLAKDMNDWGANFEDMARGALQRTDGKPFTNEEALKLYGMGLANVSSESSLSTMPTGFYNNPIIRVAAPLLGWSFRRAQMVADLARNPQGKHDLMAISSAMAGLAIAATGGLGVSAMVNLYSEDLLGKKRNLRPLVGADAEQTMLGLFENLNRVGTLGLFGELANGVVNVGTGEDNRIIDLDQRVVALSAFGNIQRAISSFINQGEADYSHVLRPLASSMGGVGMLQYMQLANHALGLDNPESRTTARTNVRNWLRAAGRSEGIEVRESASGGGGANVTPVSPSLTRMELAAYGNSPGEFHQAYVDAVQAAKDMGNPDPVDYVKRAFTARNPLKQIYRTPPSAAEYQQLLSGMPERGADDVRDAIQHFNSYAEQIGARPFDGRQENTPTPMRFTLPQFRQKAAAAL